MGRKPSTPPGELSPREKEVIAELYTGKNNREIAEKLCISEKCVKFHLTRTYKKLNVRSRTEAIAKYYKSVEAPAQNPETAAIPFPEPLPSGVFIEPEF